MKVKLDDLLLALYFVSDTFLSESAAYISKETGKIYYISENLDSDEDLPDDLSNENKYISVPDKFYFDLGHPLVWEFVESKIPDYYDEVRGIFSRRGAYSRYKSLLDELDLLIEWHRFEEQKAKEALIEWCKEENIELEI